MSLPLNKLLDSNQAWAEKISNADPEYFSRLASQQTPEYFWIGCADSRVPANEILGLAPGEVFVHRNVANVVVHSDLNCLSVLQYAVDVLRVKHVLIVGHYGCGGIRAALQGLRLGLIDNWLRHVQDIRDKHRDVLAGVDQVPDRIDRLCELNVIEQVMNVSATTIMQDAWSRGQEVSIHGWAYGLKDGILRDLGVSVSRESDLITAYSSAVERAMGKPDSSLILP